MSRNPEEDRLSPEEREDRERQAADAMNQAPAPGPLDSESVKLLVKGDWLSDGFYDPWQFSHIENGTVYGLDGYTAMIEPLLLRNSFIGRPGADGWMPWSGGENPVPGRMVDFDDGTISLVNCLSNIFDVWEKPGRFRLAPTAPVEETNTSAEHVKETAENEHVAAPVEASGSERDESAGDMLSRLGMDGKLWAEEFQKTALSLGYPEMDDGWLLGWFCNAVMAGYDHARRKYDPEVLAVFRPQPSGETRDAVSESELRDAITLILPLAKGYAAANPVGSNQSYVDYVENLVSGDPLALGGQNSGGEVEDDDPHSPCDVCGDEHPDGVLEDGCCPSCCDDEED
jgi:hypothetical protein